MPSNLDLVLDNPYCHYLDNPSSVEEPAQRSVKFLRADDEYSIFRAKVRKFLYAEEWTASDMANLKFKWVGDNENALIRVKYNTGVSRSKVGKDCETVTDQSEPTLELSYPSSYVEQARAFYIRHEFGHVFLVGLQHEHQCPDIDIPWTDKELVYEAYKDKGRDWVDADIFRRFAAPDVQCSREYDKKSVMHYDIQPEWVTNQKYAVPYTNIVLSDGDKGFAAECYPRRPGIAQDVPPANVVELEAPSLSDAVALTPKGSVQLSSNGTGSEVATAGPD
ncbi:hypothetical protein C8J56DRAFT_899894 [Mycena floridula]|nr:hypothetical protein C8J56DRAFT_899894 [Mycena floridula]